jgi:hypothetical protein
MRNYYCEVGTYHSRKSVSLGVPANFGQIILISRAFLVTFKIKGNGHDEHEITEERSLAISLL